jgi:hypothetical protein
MSEILNENDWQKHIDYKKKNILEQIDKSNSLDNSIENKKFIDILKSIINCKLFNVSKFTFLAIKLLVTPLFIDSHIIFDILNNVNQNENDNQNDNQNVNMNMNMNINNNPNPETNLKNIIKLIIDFVVQIEISLNYHCILIIHFLNKVKLNKITENRPNIFSTFSKIDNNITQSIKSSTIILLFLKFVRNLGGYQYNESNKNIYNSLSNIITNFKNNSIICSNFNIKKTSKISSNIKMYLDTFMININNYFINSNENSNLNIYSICIDYIISIVEILYNEFNYLFDILELSIISNFNYKNKNFTEDKKKELDNIKNEIKNLIINEINICKELFKM